MCSHPSIFVDSCELSCGNPDFIGMDGQADRNKKSSSLICRLKQPIGEQQVLRSSFSPFDALAVSEVMSLSPLLVVKQNHDRRNEVNNLSGWKEVDVCSAVSSPVTVPARSQGNTWTTAGDVVTFTTEQVRDA